MCLFMHVFYFQSLWIDKSISNNVSTLKMKKTEGFVCFAFESHGGEILMLKLSYYWIVYCN